MNVTKERSCDGKKQYRNRKSAMKGLIRLQRYRHEERLNVYRCLYGAHFHVGHKKAKEGVFDV